MWKYRSVPVCTWDDIFPQGPPSLKTATPGEEAEHTHTKPHNAPELNKCLILAVCAVTVPGNAPMKTALVRDGGCQCTASCHYFTYKKKKKNLGYSCLVVGLVCR